MSNRMLASSRRRRLSLGIAAALASTALSPGAGAQPETVSRLVVGYPAGGLADRLGRILAEALSEASPSSFIVENRPGAGGMIATEQVARADGDGKVLLLHNVDVLTMERALKNDPGFDPLRNLKVVAPVARFEYFVVANADLGLRNLADLVALGRRSSTSLFYIDVGPGVRTVFESLKKKYGLDLVGVPYRGLAPAMTDLLEGRVGLAMLDGATAATYASNGQLTIIGRADAMSARASSEVPTLIEQGAAGLWVETRFALMAPASTPRETIEKLRALVTSALKKPSVRARLEKSDYHPIDAAPEQFERSVAETVEHYRGLARQVGMLPKTSNP